MSEHILDRKKSSKSSLLSSGEIRCEGPNNDLSRFNGSLTINGIAYPLDNEKMLLRGCKLRNTRWCYGVVVFAGISLSFFATQ